MKDAMKRTCIRVMIVNKQNGREEEKEIKKWCGYL
jgi:hypothetical protein